MHIKQLMAENFKRLKVVNINPRGHVVKITGRNGSGKSSALDAIAVALGGMTLADPESIHRGEKKAVVRITLSDGVTEMIVTRTFTDSGSTLMVEDASGKLSAPQKVLDALLGHLAFDPLAFTRQSPKVQYETLRQLVPLDDDVDALDAANKVDAETRKGLNREAKALRARLEAEVNAPEDTPAAELDPSAIEARLQEASQHNGKVDAAHAAREAHSAKVAKVEERIENGRRVMVELEEQLAAMRAEAFDALPDRIDTQPLVAQLSNIGQINENVRHHGRLKLLVAAADEHELHSDQLGRDIAEREAKKRASIERANMPIKDLSFGDGVVLLGGVPLQQASTAEQIRASLAIGMASNPRLRVIHIHDGSLLDEDSMALVTEMATEHDYQVWLEKVDSSGRVGLVFEDGAVVADYQDGPDITKYRKPKEPKAPEMAAEDYPEQSTDPSAPNYVAF